MVAMGFVGVRAYIATKVNRNMYSRVFDMTKHVAHQNGITIDKRLDECGGCQYIRKCKGVNIT